MNTTRIVLEFEHATATGDDLDNLVGKVITLAESRGYTTRTSTRTSAINAKVPPT